MSKQPQQKPKAPLFEMVMVSLAFVTTFFMGAMSSSYRMDGSGTFLVFVVAFICFIGLLSAAGNHNKKTEAKQALDILQQFLRSQEEKK